MMALLVQALAGGRFTWLSFIHDYPGVADIGFVGRSRAVSYTASHRICADELGIGRNAALHNIDPFEFITLADPDAERDPGHSPHDQSSGKCEGEYDTQAD